MVSSHEIHWTPTIGDPTVIGWSTVACYFICCLLCLRVYRNGTIIFQSNIQRQQLFWLALAAITLILGINKQLDLQTLLTQIAKYYTYEYDLYKYRRLYQKIFIISIFVVTIITLITMIFTYRKVVRQNIAGISGLCLLANFILIRASTFHSVDFLINDKIIGTQFNWLLELSGLVLIGFNALKLGKSINLQEKSVLST